VHGEWPPVLVLSLEPHAPPRLKHARASELAYVERGELIQAQRRTAAHGLDASIVLKVTPHALQVHEPLSGASALTTQQAGHTHQGTPARLVRIVTTAFERSATSSLTTSAPPSRFPVEPRRPERARGNDFDIPRGGLEIISAHRALPGGGHSRTSAPLAICSNSTSSA
jgi:hypothetical protein